MRDHLEGFDSFPFEGPLAAGDSASFTVHHRGEGPPVIIWQELPGIGPQTLRLAERLEQAGYAVYLPHLFGPLGRVSFAGNIARLFCMRRVFHLFAANRASPVVNWMKALCRHVRDRHGGRQVGTIGMCLTGNFALALMADDAVLAGVASQPSLPVFNTPALHMSADEIAAARRGMKRKGPALAMRYEGDPICRAGKMQAIERAFGKGVIIRQFPGRGHSLLTLHWNEQAFQTVLDYLSARFGHVQDAS